MDAEDLALLCEEEQQYNNVDVPAGEMSPRERFMNIMDFRPVDRVIDAEFGYWQTTLDRWHQEGLPEYVNNNVSADIFFGFDRWMKRIPAQFGLCPRFEPEVLSDNGNTTILLNNERIKMEVFSAAKDSGVMPHFIDFPIKDTASYRELFKERLQPLIEKRITADYSEIAQQVENRNYVLGIMGGSTAGKIHDWMGFETICMAIYDQPELLEEILGDLEALMCAVAREVAKHMTLDLVFWWEDIAYKNGPIVTPSFFIQKCGRVMRNVMEIYQQAGCRFSYVDCDGDFRKLMPGWLDNGVNIMFPLEVGAGMHPVRLRNDYPGLRMMGGVDKSLLTQSPQDIKKELLALKAVVDEGGFIPHVDHRVPDNVSYQQYLMYLEIKRDLFGISNQVLS